MDISVDRGREGGKIEEGERGTIYLRVGCKNKLIVCVVIYNWCRGGKMKRLYMDGRVRG